MKYTTAASFLLFVLTHALPDLTVDLAFVTDTLQVADSFVTDPCLMDAGCVPATGKHRLLRFGVRTHNIAFGPDADLVIGAPNTNDSSTWEFHACHDHWHSLDYIHAQLLSIDGIDVVASSKHSFCLRDTRCTRASASRKFNCKNQGITAGCYDEYDTKTPCQWMVIDGVATDQEYILRITVDPFNRIAETNEANNVVETTFLLDDIINSAPVLFGQSTLLLLLLLVLCFIF